MTRYVPLQSLWPTNGSVSVVVGCLEDAGFHPVVECDHRGWFYFRGWPQGSERPVTIWIPDDEWQLATAFLDAPIEPVQPASDDAGGSGMWWFVARYRAHLFVGWAFMLLLFGT